MVSGKKLTPYIKAAPVEAPVGGIYVQGIAAPNNIIYDTTASGQSGNIYPIFANALVAMNQFNGVSYLYIQNGSVIPSGTWEMPPLWNMDVDGYGTTITSGAFFLTSPGTITGLQQGVIACHTTAEASIFTITNATLEIVGATLALGTTGTLINDVTGVCLITLDNVIVTSAGMMLI